MQDGSFLLIVKGVKKVGHESYRIMGVRQEVICYSLWCCMKKLIIANWKSNKTFTQAEDWLAVVANEAPSIDLQKVTPVIAPPFPFLAGLVEPVKQLGWQLGAQDISPFPAGSYTGAVAGQNLKNLGVDYVIVGHSERRKHFHETDQLISQKVEQVLELGAVPVLCVNENSLESQAVALSNGVAERCVVAYEPVAAIGSGDNASLETVKKFRQQTERLFGRTPFLYGGSVDELNIGEYMLVTDGSLVGTASLDVKQFIKLLKTAQGESPTGL